MIKTAIIVLFAFFIGGCNSKGDIKSVSKLYLLDSTFISTDVMSATMTCNKTIYAKRHVLYFDDDRVVKVQFFMPDFTYFMTRGDLEKDSLMSTLLALDAFETIHLVKGGVAINDEILPVQKCSETGKLLFTYKKELYYVESY